MTPPIDVPMQIPRLQLAAVALASVASLAAPAGAFTVTAPKDMAVVQPGQLLPVRVDLGSEKGVRQIEYYWYGEGEEPMGSHRASPAYVATASSDPPYGGTVTVPEAAIGLLRLLAVAEVTGGRLGAREEFDEVLLRVEPSSPVVQIAFETEKPWRLRTIGRVTPIPVVAEFEDGVWRPIGSAAAGSTFRSSDNGVVMPHPDGLLRVVGNGRATLTVTNGGQRGSIDVVVQAEEIANEWPRANAGAALQVRSGELVSLNGTMSMDPDGDPLRYRWKQVRGHKVPLMDADQPKARFMAPKVSAKRLLRFQLQVTDMEGADRMKGADSLPAFVDVWVEP